MGDVVDVQEAGVDGWPSSARLERRDLLEQLGEQRDRGLVDVLLELVDDDRRDDRQLPRRLARSRPGFVTRDGRPRASPGPTDPAPSGGFTPSPRREEAG